MKNTKLNNQATPTGGQGFANIVAIIIGVLFLVAAGGYLVVKKTSAPSAPAKIVADETANWNVYRDDQYGFSIKYPDDWFVTSTWLGYGVFLGEKPPAYGHEQLTIGVFPLIERRGDSMEDILQRDYVPKGECKKITFAGETSYSCTVTNDLDSHLLLVKRDDLTFAIDDYFRNATSGKIISTFKFTNETAGWDIFSNPRDGYAFKYPPDKLGVGLLSGINAGNNLLWSAQIGYSDRLGAFSDLFTHNGDIQSAINAYFGDNTGRIQIVDKVDQTINGKPATIVIRRDTQSQIPYLGRHIYIQYQKNKVLILKGPAVGGEWGEIFDRIVSTLTFVQ